MGSVAILGLRSGGTTHDNLVSSMPRHRCLAPLLSIQQPLCELGRKTYRRNRLAGSSICELAKYERICSYMAE